MNNLIRANLVIIIIAGFFLPINAQVITGAEKSAEYVPLLKDKKVGLVANHTSLVGNKHLLDYMLEKGIEVVKVFAPEHGFRGNVSAGEVVSDEVDQSTGVPIVSLYGANRKPSQGSLSGVDIIVFDMQDVGCRFYTYISTLQMVMEAAAVKNVPVMVFDRPNPNAWYIDGPVLKPGYESFVGLQPVPVVYGMTIGEYARMINEEGWLQNGVKTDLRIIKLENWNHNTRYKLPVKPSPNLPNMDAVYLYPSLCFFEGTEVSVGRGTANPFQVIGCPDYPAGDYNFTPVSMPGIADHPKHEGVKCKGYRLNQFAEQISGELHLDWLIKFYGACPNKEKFFSNAPFFDKLAGNSELRNQIKSGKTSKDIRASWQKDLEKFRVIRKKYLLYR